MTLSLPCIYVFFSLSLAVQLRLVRTHAAQALPTLLASLPTFEIVGVSRHTWLSIVSLCFMYLFKRPLLFVCKFACLLCIVCMQVSQDSKKTRVTGSYELLGVGAGAQTLIF